MVQMNSDPFAPEVLVAVAEHMNTDHRDDSLRIVRSLGALPEATSASVARLDGGGVVFDVRVGDTQRSVRLPWSRPVRERRHFRREFVRMYHEAVGAVDEQS
jgi:hypothetical protein